MVNSRRITIALLIAFVLSGGFTYLLSHRIDHQAALQRSRTLNYVASARVIESGEVLKPSDVRMISWPASSPLHGAFARMEDVVGRSALYPLDPGQPLLDRQITPAGVGPGLASKIPDGMRAIALRSDEVVGVAGFLAPGSHLDVLVTYRAERSTEMMTAIVLQNAEVVAAGHQVEPDPEGKSATTTVVTLLLSPQESERAVLASTQGSIHFILRNSTDRGQTDSSPLSLSQLIGGGTSTGVTHHSLSSGPANASIKRSNAPVPEESQARIETILGDQTSDEKRRKDSTVIRLCSRQIGIFIVSHSLCCAGMIGMARASQPVRTDEDSSTVQPRETPEQVFIDTHADLTKILHLAVGRSLVLSTKTPLKRIYIGNPAVLQSYASGAEELVLTAKNYGMSSLILWDTAGQYFLYSVTTDIDSENIRSAFRSAFPEGNIHVETREGRLFLSGTVPSDPAMDSASKMALSYSRDVVNTLRIVPVHGKQVQLKLRIVEVDRSKAEQFGINFFTGGRTASSTSTQQFPSVVSTTGSNSSSGNSVSVSNPLNFFLYNYKLNVGVTLQDLENRQILQILAEPTLTTLSGTPARFLSGGEFPVPIVQGGTGNSTAITIMYRPYGVKVDFTPTVNEDNTIRLKISPEVSTLDYTNSVTISGSTVPALATRRADTEVEIRNGESFVLSGLLDHRTTDSLANVPGIANIPILGELFRSKNISHSVLELVVLVTATIVDPLTTTLGTSEPTMALPNLDSNVFDVRLKATSNDKAGVIPSVLAPPEEKP